MYFLLPRIETFHTGLNRTIFPSTVYTTSNVKADSVGGMMRERMRVKRLEAAGQATVTPSGGSTGEATAGAMTTELTQP